MSRYITDRQIVSIVLVVLAALVLVPLLFRGWGMMGYGPMGGGMWGSGHGGMWGGGPGSGQAGGVLPGWAVLVGVVMQLLFLAAIVAAGYFVYRAVTRSGGSDRALEELLVAYARGDLSDEEYERRRERLEGES